MRNRHLFILSIVLSAALPGGTSAAKEEVLINPLPGSVVVGKFGENWYLDYVRQGVNLSVKGTKADVLAAASGVVISAAYDKHYDLTVVVSHGHVPGVLLTKYSSLRTASVVKGQKLEAGQKIAVVTEHYGGRRLFPPLLHFEVIGIGKKPVDPCGFFSCEFSKEARRGKRR
jgi:murein DD-endopeptidase MepM/ murein hydrolase activator NlpD